MVPSTIACGFHMKNLTIDSGNCNHRRHLPELVDIVASGRMQLAPDLSPDLPFDRLLDASKAFDHRDEGGVKVALDTAA